MPCLATMYPGRLTHTTSSTASKTSRTRWPKSGCEVCPEVEVVAKAFCSTPGAMLTISAEPKLATVLILRESGLSKSDIVAYITGDGQGTGSGRGDGDAVDT